MKHATILRKLGVTIGIPGGRKCSGVYILGTAHGLVIYVGATKNIRGRLSGHRVNPYHKKIKTSWRRTWHVLCSRRMAGELEQFFINLFRPSCNQISVGSRISTIRQATAIIAGRSKKLKPDSYYRVSP